MTDIILYIVGAVIELSNILLCYSQILQLQITGKREKIYLAYAGIILCNVINILCGLKVESTTINIVCCLLSALLVFDSNKFKGILLYPCAFMVSSITNVAVSFLMALILDVSQVQVADNANLALAANSCFIVIMGSVYLVRRMKKTREEVTLYFNNSIYVAITIGAIVFYVLIGLVQFIGSVYEMSNLGINLLGFFLSLVGILFVVFFLWLSITVYKKEMLQNEKNMLGLYLSEQEKYIQLILEKDRDMRRFRHDVKEHMHIISQCVSQKDYQAAENYINKVCENFDKAQMERYTGITAIDAIISEKRSCMDGKGIVFVCETDITSLPKHIERYDVCTLLVNILNNAVEACEDMEPEERFVKLIMDTEREKLYIYENNKCSKAIGFDDCHNPITTKENTVNHGLGSKNIRNVVEKYDGELVYSVDEHNFVIEIII